MNAKPRKTPSGTTVTREAPALAGTPLGGRRPMATELEQVRTELETLANIHARMQEAEETLRAIRNGEVDALFGSDEDPEAAKAQVFTLSSADRPYRIFVENMQEGAATLSATGVILFANPRLGDLLGCPTSSLVSRQLTQFVTAASTPDLLAALASNDLGTTLEVSLARPDNGTVAVLAGVSSLDVEGERLTCLTFTDLTAEHGLLNEVRESEERYRSIVENAQEGISTVDAQGLFTFANLRTANLLGRDVDSLTGMRAEELIGRRRTIGGEPMASQNGYGTAQYEISVIRPDGTGIQLLISTAPIVLSDSGDAGTLCMMSDVSGLRHAEEELAHWALHDSLTGLPNRVLLVDRIDQAFSRASRRPATVAALFCDLDGFKEINDSFGHNIGDQVLSMVAERLKTAVRPADTVARIGGDEFVILCEGMDDESVAFGIAARVLSSVAEQFNVGGHAVTLSVSIGVAFARNDSSAELLGDADAAMYLAKQRGRNRAELFDEQLRKVASERISLIADLRHAVARDELRVHYQPIFKLDTEELLGVEALVRWQHPERGLLAPDSFIPAAESANLIGEIGAWVLGAACRQAARWAHAGPGGQPLHMAVNVSARQLAQGSGLVELVADELRDSGIDPGTLVLEVTESVVMDNAEATLSLLNELKNLGVRLAIDDFGTGYSSLIYLKRFPVDQLKVDRAFVSGLGDDSDDFAIVASVVSLAGAVGIVAIAEGVETATQLAALQGLGCGCGQGYLWSRPLPADELEQMMRLGAFRIPTQRTQANARKATGSGKKPARMDSEDQR